MDLKTSKLCTLILNSYGSNVSSSWNIILGITYPNSSVNFCRDFTVSERRSSSQSGLTNSNNSSLKLTINFSSPILEYITPGDISFASDSFKSSRLLRASDICSLSFALFEPSVFSISAFISATCFFCPLIFVIMSLQVS